MHREQTKALELGRQRLHQARSMIRKLDLRAAFVSILPYRTRVTEHIMVSILRGLKPSRPIASRIVTRVTSIYPDPAGQCREKNIRQRLLVTNLSPLTKTQTWRLFIIERRAVRCRQCCRCSAIPILLEFYYIAPTRTIVVLSKIDTLCKLLPHKFESPTLKECRCSILVACSKFYALFTTSTPNDSTPHCT